MRILNWLEETIRNLLEGIFRRRFRIPLQPVEVAKSVLREMSARRNVSVTTVYVPNVYLVWFSPHDWESLSCFESALTNEIAGYLAEKALEKGYTLVGPVRVTFEVEEEIKPGHLRIHSHFAEEKALAENEGKTVLYQKKEEVKGKLVVREGPDAGKVFPLSAHTQVIGRKLGCALFLSDPKVSRQHAQIDCLKGFFFLTDLGSTNGTYVNGTRIQRCRLWPGDRITLGQTTLEVQEE